MNESVIVGRSSNMDASELQTLIKKIHTERQSHLDRNYINFGHRQLREKVRPSNGMGHSNA